MLLATDLDGTFLGGTPVQKEQLYRIINNGKGIQLVFVSGRGLATIPPFLMSRSCQSLNSLFVM